MELIKATLEASPLAALFLAIAIGYAVGEIKFKGFSFGVGAVLFVALAIGAFAPKSAPPALLGTLGLLLFLYGVGIQYGKEFISGLTSVNGLKANVSGMAGVVAAGALALAAAKIWNIPLPEALGMFAGSGTSTSTLQAAIDAFHSHAPAVGYSVAYPFGVAGPILCMYLYMAIRKPKIDPPKEQRILPLEVSLENTQWVGKAFAELARKLPYDIQVVAIREAGHNHVPCPETILQAHTELLIVGTDPARLEEARQLIGTSGNKELIHDRSDLMYYRVFASKRSVIGIPLSQLKLSGDWEYVYVHVRRGDADIVPHDDLVLEYGDRIGVLAPLGRLPELLKFFGGSIKTTAEFSYISVGIGAALGLMIGMIPIPIPGVGKLTLGLAGLLLVSLFLGKIRRTGSLVWTMPLSANLVLRNFGLTVFLAAVGLGAGPQFGTTVSETGWFYLGVSAAILFAYVFVSMFFAFVVFRIPVDETFGIVSGATGNPAIVAYASQVCPTDKPDIGYAMIFPTTTIAKILFVQVMGAILVGG